MLNEDVNQASSFELATGLCLAYNDGHEQTTCPIYQYQEYLSRSGGIDPPDVADHMNQNVNMMNFASTNVSIFAVEIRLAKRPLISNLLEKNVEPLKNPSSMVPKK